MPVDTEQKSAEIGSFDGCLHYAIIKLEINLFNIMVRVNQVVALILAIISQYAFKIGTAFHFLNIIFMLLCYLLSWDLHLLILIYVSNSMNIVTNKFHIYIVWILSLQST